MPILGPNEDSGEHAGAAPRARRSREEQVSSRSHSGAGAGDPRANWLRSRTFRYARTDASAEFDPEPVATVPERRLIFDAGVQGALLDGLGLLLAASVATLPIPANQRLLFAGLLLVVGCVSWLVAAQHRSVLTVLTKRNPWLLLAPVFAPMAVLLLEALARGYYSIRSLATYGVIWGIWMVLVRATGVRARQRTTVLVPGSPEYFSELRRLRDVTVLRADTPPETFGGLDVVVTAPMESYSTEWLHWLTHADLAGVRLMAAPLALEHLTGCTPVETLHDRWAEGVLAGRSSYSAWKRWLDILVVLVASPVLLLLSLCIAAAVMVSSGRPVIFVQERTGKGGVPFRMLKFRTMRMDAERHGPSFASEDDPRVTRVGRLLRKLRLDEIPQFWNVLKGDMSIIGPRPEQTGFTTLFETRVPHYGLRHMTRPGITGWAQVMQGYAADVPETSEKLRYDLYYVRHRSFLLDVEVVVRTIGIILTGFGAR